MLLGGICLTICPHAGICQEPGLRVQVRIAADRVEDANVVHAAMDADEEVTPHDGRAAEWVPYALRQATVDKYKDAVVRKGRVLVLDGPKDVDAEVEQVLNGNDASGQPVVRLVFNEASALRLYELTRERVGRMVVVIRDGRVVQIGKLVQPLRDTIVIPAYAVEGSSICLPGNVTGSVAQEGRPHHLVIIGVLALAVIASLVIMCRLFWTKAPTVCVVISILLGSLTGAVLLAIVTTTEIIGSSSQAIEIGHHLSVAWLGLGAVIGAIVGYSICAVTCAWRKGNQHRGHSDDCGM